MFILHDDVQRSGKVHFSSSSNFRYKKLFVGSRFLPPDAYLILIRVFCGGHVDCQNSVTTGGYASEFNFLLISVYECHHYDSTHICSRPTNISISLSERSRLFDSVTPSIRVLNLTMTIVIEFTAICFLTSLRAWREGTSQKR